LSKYGFKIFSITVAAVLTLLNSVCPSKYDEPIDSLNGGDPFIVEDGDDCYYTYTLGNRIEIFKVNSFKDLTVTDRKVVYRSGNNGIKGQIWAPEIHKIGNRWYIVAAAVFDARTVERGTMPGAKENRDHDDYYRYGFVLESKTEDVFGEYTFKGILAPDGMNNIDGTYLQKDGKLYYVSSAYMDVGHQCLYISEMENPYTLKADENGKNNAVKISAPVLPWEIRGWKVNEGPAVLYNGDDIYIIYSASGYSSGGYCMGMLTLTGDDVLNPCHWLKSLKPVSYHKIVKGIYSAGHCSFLYRENGDIYMVYHANATYKFDQSPRLTYIKKVEFAFGKPVLK